MVVVDVDGDELFELSRVVEKNQMACGLGKETQTK